MSPARRLVFGAISAAVLGASAVAVLASRSGDEASHTRAPSTPAATSPAATPSTVVAGTLGGATTKRAAAVRAHPSTDADVLSRLRAGILLPVAEERDGFLSVLTPCEVRGWVASSDVDVHPKASPQARSLRDATIVIDPGHGGILSGAVGPSGLPEKEPNHDIARRLADRLEGSRVFLTLSGDYEAGLEYRSAIADALSAHAFVSIHNNAEPDGPSERPGSEIYYQYRSGDSKRLSGLLYEELIRALDRFDADWVADRDAGAKYRLNESGIDYYGLLRRADVPAVLVEALFVANASEEALLRRTDVRDAIAGALATGLRRFFETADPGSGFVEPYPREPGPSGRLPARCVDPAS